MTRKIVIIGYGLAAHRLATDLLAQSASETDLDVTVYAGETTTPYDRTLLPEVLSGRYAPDGASLPPPPDDPRLRVRHGVRAMGIDRLHRLVHGSDGWVEPYDVLVLATGANAVLPPIRGLRATDGTDLLPGVHTVHTLEDFRRLGHEAASAEHAVVIGGGATGIRIAQSLYTMRNRDPWRGLMHVELVDQSPAAPEITPGDAFRALRTLGVIAYQDCRVRSVTEGADGRVSEVILADGYRLTCDLAVIACGTAPNVHLAWTSGLAVARGIVVDDALRSVSDPNVYAIGDCAEHRRTVSGSATVALEQATALAARLSGTDPFRTYQGVGAGVGAGTAVGVGVEVGAGIETRVPVPVL